MRILMINYEFPPIGGGASPVSYEIAKGLVKLGHEVDVVTMNYKDLPSFEVVDKINIYRIKSLRSRKEICKTHEMLSFVISAKWFLKRHLKENKYDICHCHFIIPTGIVALWMKKKFGINYIITAHGSDVIGYNPRFKFVYPLISNTWKKIITNANVVTTPSLFLQKEIKKITSKGNFVVIENGIDENKFKGLKKEKRILVVCRLFENKGVQTILDAIKDVELNEWIVDIVGDGPYREYLVKKTKEYRLENKVKFHGWIDNKSKEMKQFYGHASIFISASQFESFGLTIIEAISSKCYPLISNIETHKNIVKNNKYLFEKNNSNSLKLKLKKLIEMKELKVNVNLNNYNQDNINLKFERLLLQK